MRKSMLGACLVASLIGMGMETSMDAIPLLPRTGYRIKGKTVDTKKRNIERNRKAQKKARRRK